MALLNSMVSSSVVFCITTHCVVVMSAFLSTLSTSVHGGLEMLFLVNEFQMKRSCLGV